MVYCMSDLHGFPLPRVLSGLRSVRFNEDDFLFVIGDVIDRNGDGGIELLRWMMEQPNVELLMGNHEAMLLSCRFIFQHVTDDLLDSLTQEQMGLLLTWMQNGGDVTIKSLSALGKANPEALIDLVDYMMMELGGRC